MTAPDGLAAAEAWLPLPVDTPPSPGAHAARVAAAAYVRRVRPSLFRNAEGTTTPDPVEHADVVYGAQLLAARLWARRGSPTGLASFGEFGAAAVVRLDPDLERLLSTGRYARPVAR